MCLHGGEKERRAPGEVKTNIKFTHYIQVPCFWAAHDTNLGISTIESQKSNIRRCIYHSGLSAATHKESLGKLK